MNDFLGKMTVRMLHSVLDVLVVFLLTLVGVFSLYKDHQSNNCFTSDGSSYPHGQIYTVERTGICLRYRCDYGKETHISTECRDENGRCYAVGEKRHHSECVEQTCTMDNGYISMKATSRECSFNGQCLKPTHVVQDGCAKYQCTETVLGRGKYSLGMKLIDAGCRYSGYDGCIPLGETIECGSLRCERRGNIVSFYEVRPICRDPETGACHELGARWTTRSCVDVECEADLSSESVFATHLAVKGRGCPDDIGECHIADGISTFLKTLNGRRRRCVCKEGAHSAKYSCRSSMW